VVRREVKAIEDRVRMKRSKTSNVEVDGKIMYLIRTLTSIKASREHFHPEVEPIELLI
jgi:hypothetical protein